MPSEIRVWRATDFTGGRNTQSSQFDLAPNESPDDINMDGQIVGAIRRRAGLVKFSATKYGAEPITGLYRYYRTNGDKFLMVLNGTNLWAGEGTPPNDLIIKPDLTPGSQMFFITMQDWCYFVNFLDRPGRFDGTDVRRMGVAAPAVDAGFPIVIRTTTSEGRINQNGYFTYRFRFRYGKLGTSNLSPFYRTGFMFTSSNTMRLSGLNTLMPGHTFSLTPAEAGAPTHIQIYRTLTHQVPSPTDQQARDFLYYLVDEVRFLEGLDSSSVYEDYKDDVELLTQYPPPGELGHTFSEPYLDAWVADPDTAAFAELDGYQQTAKTKFVEEHRNRVFYAGVEETLFDSDGAVDSVIEYPSRLYWTSLYQPDRWVGFIDVNPEDGDEITQILSFHNNLIIFKRSRTYLLLGSSPVNFEVRLVNAEVGLVAPRALATLDNRVIFYAGRAGIYAFDGSNFARISNKIRPDILSIRQATRELTAAGSQEGRFYIGYEEST